MTELQTLVLRLLDSKKLTSRELRELTELGDGFSGLVEMAETVETLIQKGLVDTFRQDKKIVYGLTIEGQMLVPGDQVRSVEWFDETFNEGDDYPLCPNFWGYPKILAFSVAYGAEKKGVVCEELAETCFGKYVKVSAPKHVWDRVWVELAEDFGEKLSVTEISLKKKQAVVLGDDDDYYTVPLQSKERKDLDWIRNGFIPVREFNLKESDDTNETINVVWVYHPAVAQQNAPEFCVTAAKFAENWLKNETV